MVLDVRAARAEALFCSPLAGRPSPAEVKAAIVAQVRSHGGIRGCAAELAQAYGDNEAAAAKRMRWARRVVADTYPPSPARPGQPSR